VSDVERLEHPSDDAIVDLAHGLAPEAARAEMLGHLKSCPACERRMVDAWRDREIARAGTEGAGRSRVRRRRTLWITLAAAASIAAIALLMPSRRPPLLAPDWLSFEATESMARGGAACGPGPLAADAVAAYRGKDAARVVALLDGRELPAACDPLRLLLASALLHANEPARSLQVLDALDAEILPQPARDRGRWIRALALDGLGRREEALEVLRGLASRPGEFQEKAAGALHR